jgi:hypothetical protein
VQPGPTRRRSFAAKVTLLAVGAFLAIAHEARRQTLPRAGSVVVVEQFPDGSVEIGRRLQEDTPTIEQPTPLPTIPVFRQIGPFAVGQTLAGTWSVDFLDLRDGGFMVTLTGERGRARFDLTCDASRGTGPFDLGTGHILYSRDMDFRDLEAVGRAMQAAVGRAAEGRDVCEQFLAWRMAAQTAPPR